MDQQTKQLSKVLLRRGISCNIISVNGICTPTIFSLNLNDGSLFVQWRNSPVVSCEIIYLESIFRGIRRECYLGGHLKENCICLIFKSHEIQLEFADALTSKALAKCVEDILSEALKVEKTIVFQYSKAIRDLDYKITASKEMSIQASFHERYREGATSLSTHFHLLYHSRLKDAFGLWIKFVSEKNTVAMKEDRHLWKLHACANVEVDLHAWYHAMFADEVYRLQGPFWYKDAILPRYRTCYGVVDTKLTPLEEAALAHVLCSPDTSYGDVAGQMQIVQAITSTEQFSLFQKISAEGKQIVKYPRSGRPAKKLFRISFVEGNIYLTWKGKFGNQGVDLGDVSKVEGGLKTDVLRRNGKSDRQELYLSLVCDDRSVDMLFDSVRDRDQWKSLLEVLLLKEHGDLLDIPSVRPTQTRYSTKTDDSVSEEQFRFSWLLIYLFIGEHAVPQGTL